MTIPTSPKHLLAVTTGILTTLSLQGGIISLYQGTGDLNNFTVSNSTDSDTLESGGMIRQFDNDSGGRTTMRYLPSSAFSDGLQVSFNVLDSSTDDMNVFRIGTDGASLAGGADATLGVRMTSIGNIVAETSSGNIIWGGAFTPGEQFNLSIIYNSTGSTLNVGSGISLNVNEWAITVDGAILDNGTATSTGLSNLNQTIAQDMWWLTGFASSRTGSDIQYDNIVIATGSDIAVVPEPSATVLGVGILSLAVLLVRRVRRRNRG
jgi:hypothetical protein